MRRKQQIYKKRLQSKKGEIRKSKKLCEIELANNIKYIKNFFKYYSNNKKQKKQYRSIARGWGKYNNKY